MSHTQSPPSTRLTYAFGDAGSDGDTTMKPLLGGKGADLCEMSRIGLPVPPGFVVTTDACKRWQMDGAADGIDDELREQVRAAIEQLETQTGRSFGAASDGWPLLVSVRSGAPVSMPGMMETVLNLGLNPDTVEQFARASGNERLAWDAWRRFVQMYGAVVLDVDEHAFDRVLTEARSAAGVDDDTQLDAAQLRAVGERFVQIVEAERGAGAIPSNPHEQLERSIAAVFASWNGEPARVYRAHYGIPEDLGTAVNVQSMVYGNAGDDLRCRGAVHARSGDRHAHSVRRVPARRAGRGRRVRHAHPAAGGVCHGAARSDVARAADARRPTPSSSA